VESIGQVHDKNLDFAALSETNQLHWRIVETGDHIRTFEVFKQFKPSGVPGNPNAPGMMRHLRMPFSPIGQPDKGEAALERVIYVGLDMTSLDEAGDSTLTNSIITGLLLFIAGLTGIILLFLFQNYQSTKTSLSRIKAFSDSLVDNMPIGLIALDNEKKITSVNATAEDVLNKPAKSITGFSSSDRLPPELQDLIAKSDKVERIIGEEIECQVSAEKTSPLEISISLIKEDNEKIVGYAILLKDLTEIHLLRKEVARSQKLASIGRLAAGVAHEIRNPLSSIKGFATYFRNRYQDIDKDRQTANVMINEVDRLDRVVGQLLELARPIQITPQQTELSAFIKESIHVILQQLEENDLRLALPPQEQPCLLNIDRDKISQVLLNLYLNAIDAMGPQGILKLDFWCDTEADTAHISVTDSGKGIDQKDLPKIFDPYYTTKPTGTGLGLAIVHNILEAHQGNITVDSKTGVGTTVTIIVPSIKQEKADD
jgi:two-component system sensor histidine kinase HydH